MAQKRRVTRSVQRQTLPMRPMRVPVVTSWRTSRLESRAPPCAQNACRFAQAAYYRPGDEGKTHAAETEEDFG